MSRGRILPARWRYGPGSHEIHPHGVAPHMVRMVQCAKLGRELPGLDKPPFPGALGERIYEHVSAEAYAQWLPHLTTIINHYGLNPADPETRQMLRKEMEGFFFGEQAMETAELTPDTVATNE